MSSADRPWYFDLVKEVGGLGLVLIMLVGLYLLGDKYLTDLRSTWKSIETITKEENDEAEAHRVQVHNAMQNFMVEMQVRQTEHSARMTKLEDRISDLERAE